MQHGDDTGGDEQNEGPMADDETFQKELLAEHEKTYESFIKNSVRGIALVVIALVLIVGFALVG
jgi:hypothetical protein